MFKRNNSPTPVPLQPLSTTQRYFCSAYLSLSFSSTLNLIHTARCNHAHFTNPQHPLRNKKFAIISSSARHSQLASHTNALALSNLNTLLNHTPLPSLSSIASTKPCRPPSTTTAHATTQTATCSSSPTTTVRATHTPTPRAVPHSTLTTSILSPSYHP